MLDSDQLINRDQYEALKGAQTRELKRAILRGRRHAQESQMQMKRRIRAARKGKKASRRRKSQRQRWQNAERTPMIAVAP